MIGGRCAGICGGKGDEYVAGAVAGDAAVAAEAKRDAAGQALELMRDEGSIRGDDYDDRAAIGFGEGREGVGAILRYLFADWNACDAEIGARAVIALHEHADGECAAF